MTVFMVLLFIALQGSKICGLRVKFTFCEYNANSTRLREHPESREEWDACPDDGE